MANDGETLETMRDFIFLSSKIAADGDCRHEIKRCLLLGRKAMPNPDSILKKQRHHFAKKGPSSQSYSFSSSHVQCESWTIKISECWRIVMLEKTLESPLDCKEIKPVSPKGNQPWIVIGRTKAEAESPILWPPMWRADLLEKTLMLGRIEGRRRRARQRMRWLHGITDSMGRNLSKLCPCEGQGSLTCCSPWGLNELDMTEW